MQALLSNSLSASKKKVLAQATTSLKVTIKNYEYDKVVGKFTYLGSTISSNLYLDRELDRRISISVSTLARLGTRV